MIDLNEANKSELELKLDEALDQCTIDTSKNIERPPVILFINEWGLTNVKKRLFSLGNFSCIIGKAKSKKTFLISMFTASILGLSNKFDGALPEDKPKILYFDTEQGDYDAYHCIKRIERMTGHKNPNLMAFNLRAYLPKDRCLIIEHAFLKWGSEVAYCVIDGVADLATGINDEEEATRVSSMFLRLTKEHNCHITTVIHQNKNDGFATGHLGSSIMKKAEIIISVNKTNDFKISDVKCDLSRGPQFEAFTISIGDDALPYASDIPVSTTKKSFYEEEF